MPFKSKAQMRAMAAKVKTGELSQKKFDQWVKETPNINDLPEKIGKRRVYVPIVKENKPIKTR